MSRKLKTTKGVLTAALRLIENWAKGIFKTPAGCYCALGAVNEVSANDNVRETAIYHLRMQIPHHHITGDNAASAVLNYNDTASTRHKSVINLFKRAIASCQK